MKKGLIVINSYNQVGSSKHMVDRLKEEFSYKKIKIDVKKAFELALFIDDEGNLKPSLNDYSFVIYLDKDPYVAKMIEKQGIRMFNKAEPIAICDDKMETYLSLMNKGFKMPLTIAGTLCYKGDISTEFIDEVENKLGYPLIAKNCHGSLGKQVYLIKNREELIKKEKELLFYPRLYQRFIKASSGKDYRIICVGGKVVASMKRESLNGDFRSNIGLGGKGSKISLKDEYKDYAERVASILDLDYCGIDLLEDEDGTPILCEVNSNAFFEEIEKISQINVAKEYVKYILSSLN